MQTRWCRASNGAPFGLLLYQTLSQLAKGSTNRWPVHLFAIDISIITSPDVRVFLSEEAVSGLVSSKAEMLLTMRRPPMTRDDLLIIWFCVIDDGLKTLWRSQRLRQRGPAPTLVDSEVITREIIGEYLGLNTDTAIFDFFCHHYQPFFPKLAHLHRTTFLRQAVNLYQVKAQLWRRVREAILYTPQLGITDSLALRVC
jgi:hypothetical protein